MKVNHKTNLYSAIAIKRWIWRIARNWAHRLAMTAHGRVFLRKAWWECHNKQEIGSEEHQYPKYLFQGEQPKSQENLPFKFEDIWRGIQFSECNFKREVTSYHLSGILSWSIMFQSISHHKPNGWPTVGQTDQKPQSGRKWMEAVQE